MPVSFSPTDSVRLARRTAVVSSVALLVATLALAAWQALSVLLLITVAVLLAVLLVGAARGVSRHVGIGYPWALAASALAIAGALAGLAWFVGGGVAEQVAGVGEALPAGLARVEQTVRGWGARLGVDGRTLPPVAELLPSPGDAAAHALGVLRTTVGVLGGVLIVVVMSLFLAAQPATYRGGLLHLVPPARRARAGEVLSAVVRAVRRWLAARLIVMVLTFGVAWAGLTVIGVPFPLGLAVLSGLAVFIPYVGSYASGTVAVVVALLDGPQTALWTAAFFVAQENVLGQVVEPLIEARLTAAPPALLIAAQVVLGALLGLPGILLASPLVIAAAVAVQMLYVNDALGDSVHVLGSGQDGSGQDGSGQDGSGQDE